MATLEGGPGCLFCFQTTGGQLREPRNEGWDDKKTQAAFEKRRG